MEGKKVEQRAYDHFKDRYGKEFNVGDLVKGKGIKA